MKNLAEWDEAGRKSVDVREVNKLCERAFQIRDKKSELKLHEKSYNLELDDIKEKLLNIFNEAKLDGFDATHGRVSLKNYFGVKTPKTVEEKRAFAKYLQEKKIFWEMISFNSSQLNSFYDKEMEIAKEQGNVDFAIPGIGAPTHSQDVTFRKKGKSNEQDE